MKSFLRQHIVFILGSFFLFLPSLVFAGVKIELKNGRTIIADSCEDTGASLACSKMGGTFDIEKKDIEKIREVSGGSTDDEVAPDGTDATQETGQGKKEPDGRDNGDRTKGAPAGAGVTGDAGRLEEIKKRKLEMAPERERLLKERQELQEDMKKAPDWMPVNQYEELQKRNAELDEKIKKFNEEVGGLDRQEKNIIDKGKEKKD